MSESKDLARRFYDEVFNAGDLDAIDLVRVVDGKAAEHWGVTDAMGLMQQIGAVPQEAA